MPEKCSFFRSLYTTFDVFVGIKIQRVVEKKTISYLGYSSHFLGIFEFSFGKYELIVSIKI